MVIHDGSLARTPLVYQIRKFRLVTTTNISTNDAKNTCLLNHRQSFYTSGNSAFTEIQLVFNVQRLNGLYRNLGVLVVHHVDPVNSNRLPTNTGKPLTLNQTGGANRFNIKHTFKIFSSL